MAENTAAGSTPAANAFDEALRLLHLGYSVIPLDTRGKEPLVHWKTYQQQRASEEELRGWWAKWPTANLGVITGQLSGIVVVDIDESRGGELDKMLELGPTEHIVRTAHGYHLWYHYPPVGRVSNRVGQDGVDVRGEGGMVVVPPSIHPSGIPYSYVRNGELGTAPLWVKDLPGPNLTTRGESWISTLLEEGVERGSRNASCASLAGYFYGKRIPLDIALVLLTAWNMKNKPPLAMDVIDRTVRSVYDTAGRRETVTTTIIAAPGETVPGETVPAGEDGIVKIKEDNRPLVVDSLLEADHPSMDLSAMTYEAFLTRYGGAETRWLIKDWLPSETVAFIVAPPGSYKTWMALDLAISVAGGYQFLGFKHIEKPGSVLLFQQEDPPEVLAKRLSAIHFQHMFGDTDIATEIPSPVPVPHPSLQICTIGSLPLYLHLGKMLNLSDKRSLVGLERLIRTVSPSLVVIDPLYSVGEMEDYMAKTAKQMIVLKALRDAYGCSFVIVHHTKKRGSVKEGRKTDDEEGHGREDLWGSQFLNAALETGWQVRLTDTEGTVSIRRHFKAAQNQSTVRLRFDIHDSPSRQRTIYHVRELDDTEEGPVNDIRVDNKMPDLLGFLEKNGELTAAELTTLSGMHRTTVNRKLRELVNQGVLARQGQKYNLTKGATF